MSPIQFVCAVFVPVLWGYQFVAIKLDLSGFPPLFFPGLRFLAIELLLIPFVARPTRKQPGPILAISVSLSALNFGLLYIGLGLGRRFVVLAHCALLDGARRAIRPADASVPDNVERIVPR
nr:hypothetical protein [Cupriavidus lacunae]